MNIRDWLHKLTGCDEATILLDHALDVIETLQKLDCFPSDDEYMAEQIAVIKEFLGR